MTSAGVKRVQAPLDFSWAQCQTLAGFNRCEVGRGTDRSPEVGTARFTWSASVGSQELQFSCL